MAVVGCQPALGADLAAVPRLMESLDPRGIGLEERLDAVAPKVVELSHDISRAITVRWSILSTKTPRLPMFLFQLV
jgi:hypothetical protein